VNPLVVPSSHLYEGVTTTHLKLWCPGCGDLHMITTAMSDGAPTWTWDGNTKAPTINPSILVNQGRAHPGKEICHSFVRDGQWQFLTDSTHQLAGQTVPMVPVPDWLIDA